MARVSTYLNFNGHTEQAFELMGTDAPASMGTDAPASMGFKLSPGDNVPINLEPDSRAEADRWFSDRFGIHWMVNCSAAPA